MLIFEKTVMICNEDISLNYLSHIGFGILALSYGIKNLLYLRICIAISNCLLISWAVLALPTPSCLSTTGWNFLFLTINIYRGWEIYNKNKQQEEKQGDTNQLQMPSVANSPTKRRDLNMKKMKIRSSSITGINDVTCTSSSPRRSKV